MASAWGSAWGTSWANSWGNVGVVAPSQPVPANYGGRLHPGWHRRTVADAERQRRRELKLAKRQADTKAGFLKIVQGEVARTEQRIEDNDNALRLLLLLAA